MYHEKVRIGTVVSAHGKMTTAEYLKQIVGHGFETYQITFGDSAMSVDIKKYAAEVREIVESAGAKFSSVGIYGDVMRTDQVGKDAVASWKKLIDSAHLFGCDMVCGFTGAQEDKPIDGNIKAYAKIFGPLQKRAADKGVRIAFENCDMGGNWHKPRRNIALQDEAWEMMFDAIPSDNIGLEWEPCHQMVKLIDPIPQLRRWVGKMFHIHGKDATVQWDVIRQYGIKGKHRIAYHRTPGFGDSNWSDIITILRMGGFDGAIDIEGWHDPIYRGELEMTGQVRGLNYLKACRGGDFVPYPPEMPK